MPSCSDTARLEVVTVTFATNQLHLCEGGAVELPFTVTPAHARAQISFDTVDAQAPNLTNHLATAVPSLARPTNLVVTSLGAGAAVIRARLGASVFPGVTVNMVRGSFPPELWAVSPGGAKSFPVNLVPAGGPVSYQSLDPAIATASGSGGSVLVVGASPGIARIVLKSGTNICAMKEVWVARVTLTPSALYLCPGQSDVIQASVSPSNAPVTFDTADPAIATVTVAGTNLLVRNVSPGRTQVRAFLGTNILASSAVYDLTVAFPANEFVVLEGGINTLVPIVTPSVFAAQVSFAVADTNVARIVSGGGNFPRLEVAGVRRGVTQIIATLGTSQLCATKEVRVLPFQLTTTSAAVVAVNADDDNGSGRPDVEDGFVQAGQWDATAEVEGENDLLPVQIDMPRVAGQTVTLETMDGGIVVWRSARRGPEPPLLDVTGGGALSVSWDAAQAPDTVWVEGVTASAFPGDTTLTLRSSLGTTRRLQLTVVDTAAVEWKVVTTPLEETLDGNLRLFPDKPQPGAAGDFSAVRVRARLQPAMPGVALYFRAFDVDDPNESQTPVDDETQPVDNRARRRKAISGRRTGRSRCRRAGLRSGFSLARVIPTCPPWLGERTAGSLFRLLDRFNCGGVPGPTSWKT